MDTAEQFETFYDIELGQAVSLPERITSRYSVNACLASSDRKEVYMLTENEMNERVILRRLPPGQGEPNQAEYSLLSSLDHPHIPKAIEVFEEEGFSYLIRSYIQGNSLHQWIAVRGAASECEAIRIMVQLCDLMTYLHTRRPPVIHRDIKPQNVIIAPDGTIFLIDFDIARKFDPIAIKDTMFMGTSATAPPEQYGYGQTDARSDIYSLGVLLIFLCTGRFERAALSEMPPRLRKIAQICTQFAPKDRYASAVQLKRVLPAPKRTLLLRLAAGLAIVSAFAGGFDAGRLFEGNGAPAALHASVGKVERRTAVAEDGTVSFADGVIEDLVREKLGKEPGEPITLGEIQTITDLSVVGVPSENRSLPIDIYQDQAYQNGEPIMRGEIRTLSDLSLMKGLDNLMLVYQRIEDISPLKELHLQTLMLVGNYVTDLTPLADMKTLRHLNISNNPVTDISPLESFQRLKELYIQQCNVTDISVISKIPTLTSVDVSNIPCLDYSPLLALPLLSFVEMNDSSAQDVALVSGNLAMRELVAIHSGITDLDELKPMPDLIRLNLNHNEIKGLTGIERYKSLKNLAIRNVPVDDLTPLAGLPALEELDLRGVGADLSPLLHIPLLKKIICSPDMQVQIDQIKNEAEFEIEVLES
ncbi:MAG: protein kinase [Clostridiaceae bacterium]|nr:protein kinase [Clostridiaceae bacterium]